MTQVALRSESEFAAGVACRPCRFVGHHFCQAHDYNEADQPACKTCLTGELCGPMRARKPVPDFDGPTLPAAPPQALTKPAPPTPDPLRGEKLAETLEQREAKPGLCAYCEKPRHRGVCAARRTALYSKGTTFAGFAPPLVDRYAKRADEPEAVPEEVEIPVEPGGLDSLPYVDSPPDAASVFLASVQRPPVVTPEMRAAVKTLDPKEALQDPACVKQKAEIFTQASVGQPVFEVVSRSQVKLRPLWDDRYAELADRLRKLGTGELLKISFASEAKADNYAKNVSRRLARFKLRVKYERHGEVLFLEVKPPISPTNEVPAL